MNIITKYIYTQVANKNLSQQEAKSLLLELKNLEDHSIDDQDVAVIGMACQFPKAMNLDEYWENIKNGRNCIDTLPESRKKDTDNYFLRFKYDKILMDNFLAADGTLNIPYEIRGYVPEVDKFDADFFNILPREANSMDPKQRHMLQLFHDALENAGYSKENVYGTKAGVFIGMDHVCEIKYKKIAKSDSLVVTGTWPSILGSRISFIYNFQGPCVIIDTACSSGLVSVHMACQALKNNECTIALAGGTSSVFYEPFKFSDEYKDLGSIEATDGKVHTFSKNAGGTIWGEGAGIVILKPLKQALEDGDVIHAVIKGHAINNDGASNGITAPDAAAQEALILDVWKQSGIDPGTINYFEAHGTGTVIGDPIEVKAVTNAFRAYTDKKQFCGIGSVKTNIGHTVGASGIASLLKVILMMKHKVFVPSINFDEPNPYINFNESPIYVVNRLSEWETGGTPRRAGVNSFGFAGTNCHVLLEEPPARDSLKTEEERDLHLFTISARNQNSLDILIHKYIDVLSHDKEISLSDLCYTVNLGRGHYNYRLILMVKSPEDLKSKLLVCRDNDLENINHADIFYGYHKIVSEGKTNRNETELTEGERRKLNSHCKQICAHLTQAFDVDTAKEFCKVYIKGAACDWQALYVKPRRRISLPSYPFAKTRFWHEEEPLMKAASGKHKEIPHPLVDRCLVESLDRDIYTTTFSAETHWIINEHVIVEQNVIPGISYIELIRELARRYFHDAAVQFENMYFLLPVILAPGEKRDVQTIIEKKEDGSFHFLCASKVRRSEYNEKWIKHVEGSVKILTDVPVENIDKDNVLWRLNKEEAIVDLTPTGHKKMIELGPRWQCEEVVGIGEHEILIDLELPGDFADDLKHYALHPALLDNAINAVSQRLVPGYLYLPFMYKSIKVFGDIPKRFYSLVTINNHPQIKEKKAPELISFDVTMFYPDGRVFVEIEDYKLKKVDVEKSSFSQLNEIKENAFSLHWLKQSGNRGKKKNIPKTVVYFQNDSKKCREIGKGIQSAGSRLITVSPYTSYTKTDTGYLVGPSEDDYSALVKDIQSKKITTYVHGFGLSDDHGNTDSIQELDSDIYNGLKSMYYFIRALSINRVSEMISIYVIFSNAYKVTGKESVLYPQHAALSAFCKVVMDEFPHISIQCIDVDNKTSVDIILDEYMHPAMNPCLVSYRNNELFIGEFRRTPLRETGEFVIPSGGVYLITGGTGGLGLESGLFLAKNGAKNICLLGRSVLPEKKEWETSLKYSNEKVKKAIRGIMEMEKNGAVVTYKQADISVYNALEQVIGELRNEYNRIAGIIHCAGAGGEGLIMNKKEEIFDSVISPKIRGTWNLHNLTKQDKPDFMILFSSILSYFPEIGQSDYAAANAYMDVFAEMRTMAGLRTLSVHWPAWLETGMAVDFNINFEHTLFQPLETKTALGYLKEIMKTNMTNILPGEFNYPKLSKREGTELFTLSGEILSVLNKKEIKEVTNKDASMDGDIVLKGKGDDVYNEVENTLAKIWANVLGLKVIDIYDTLNNLGGDSMIAIELHKKIDNKYPGSIDIVDIFTYPSINQLSEHIKNKTGKSREKADKHINDMLDNILNDINTDESSIENALDKISEIL